MMKKKKEQLPRECMFTCQTNSLEQSAIILGDVILSEGTSLNKVTRLFMAFPQSRG